MIVDMRLRPPLKSWVDKPQFKSGSQAGYYPSRIGFPRPPSAEQQSIDLLVEEMDAAGVQWGVIMGRQSAAPLGVIPNDEIADLIALHPDRFVSFAGIDVSADTGEALAEIDRCLALPGFKGISIEPGASSTPMTTDDQRLYPIYEKCHEHGVPISITLSGMLGQMVGASWEFNSPQPLYQTAKDFPDLQIVISHAAWPYVQEMLGVAFVCGNVWVSPDLYMVGTNTPGASEYVKAANFYQSDRVLL